MKDLTILLTGGTGTFGQHFLTHVQDAKIRVYSRDEFKQSQLRAKHGDERVRYLIGDVRDRERLRRAAEGVDVIVHAAALKQVSSCEYNPFEAVQTNIVGTENVVNAALDCGVPRSILISSDKAVNPINVYGATKLCAEKLFVGGNAYAGGRDVRFSCVRYGNVAGSRGSVVEVFRDQALSGYEVTITDERATRFWLTPKKAVEFVLRSLERMQGGEIFVPKLSSMRVVDLVPEGCTYKLIGLRPGEKLHESLITDHELRTDNGDHYTLGQGKTGTAYSSSWNEWWVSREELLKQ